MILALSLFRIARDSRLLNTILDSVKRTLSASRPTTTNNPINYDELNPKLKPDLAKARQTRQFEDNTVDKVRFWPNIHLFSLEDKRTIGRFLLALAEGPLSKNGDGPGAWEGHLGP